MAESPPEATQPIVNGLTSAEMAYPTGSSVNLDKIVIQEPRPYPHYEPFPGTGAAFFSSDLGKQPLRKASPPFPPVIVRSDKIAAVVQTANLWRNKYPFQYHCIFPNSGWQISDLWDEADIHLETRSFLEEVLQFISRDNVYRARLYVVDWVKAHPERVEHVCGDFTHLYDVNNPMAIVDSLFVNEETRDYPRGFLWHIGHIIRSGYLDTILKENEGVSTNTSGVTRPEHSVPDKTIPVEAIASENQKTLGAQSHSPPTKTVTRSAPASTSMTKNLPVQLPATVHHHQHFLTHTGPHALPVRPQSSGQPLKFQSGHHIEHTRLASEGMRQHANMSSPQFNVPMLRVPKNRQGRSRSNSHHQVMSMYGALENHPTRVPSGRHYRQASNGLRSPFHSPQMTPPTTFGVPMVNHMVHAPHDMTTFPQAPTMMPLSMHPNPDPYHAMMQHHQQVPFNPPSMDPHFAQYHQIPHGRGAMPIGDMTNAIHYVNRAPAQHMDSRGGAKIRGGQGHNSRGLFDPYNGDKPGFADVTPYSGSARGNRSSFSNHAPRGRKFSGTLNRSNYGHYEFDRPENNGGPPSSRSVSGAFPRHIRGEEDPKITNDMEHGCSATWIGPNNQDVLELWFGEIPSGVQADEIQQIFEREIGVAVQKVAMREPGLSGGACAFVHFFSTTDTRKALNSKGLLLRGKTVSIRVPYKYYMKFPPYRDISSSGSHFGPENASKTIRYAGNSRVTPGESNARVTSREKEARVTSREKEARVTSREKEATTPTTATSTRVQYSPQDARSDLQKPLRIQSQQDVADVNASPEARKTKNTQEFWVEEPSAHSEHALGLSLQSLQDISAVGTGESQVYTPASDTVTIRRHEDVLDDIPEEITASNLDGSESAKPAKEDHTRKETRVKASISQEPNKDDSPEKAIGVTALMTQERSEDDTKDHNAISVSGEDSIEPPLVDPQVLVPVQSSQAPLLNRDTDVSLPNVPSGVNTVEHASTKVEPTDYVQTDHAVPQSQHQSDPISDVDQNNDSSFHSAQELQSDGEKMKGVTKAIPTSADNEADAPKLSVQLPKDDVKEPEPKSSSQNIDSEKKSNPAGPTEESSQETATAAKKRGVKQTESLHPFAKQTKSRSKKEREKEARKKKKAEKAKADRAKPGQLEVSPGITESQITSTIEDLPSSSTTETQSEITTEIGAGSHFDGSRDAGGSDSFRIAAIVDQTEKSGEPTVTPTIASETRKLPTEPMTVAPSTEPVDIEVSGSHLAPCRSAVTVAQVPEEKNEKQNSSKQIKKSLRDRVAIPNLDLLKRRTSPTGKVKSTTATFLTNGANQSKASSSALGDVKQVIKATCHQSSASSTTLVPSSPNSTSPSPTSAMFYTPAQTPITSAAPQSEAPKKNKKNKKKHNSSKSNTATEPNTLRNGTPDIPFSAQFNNIDRVIAETQIQDSEHACQSSLSGHTEEDEYVDEQSIIGEIQQFLRHNDKSSDMATNSNVSGSRF